MMNTTEKNRLECERYNLEVDLDFWKRQQEQTRDMDYWHYTERRIQVLNERLDGIRRKLEGVNV